MENENLNTNTTQVSNSTGFNQNNATVVSYNNTQPKQNNSIKIGAAIIIPVLIILGALGFTYYNMLSNSIYEIAINAIADDMIGAVDEFEKRTVLVTNDDNSIINYGNLSFNSNLPGLESFNGAEMAFEIGLDYENDNLFFNTDFIQNDVSFLDFSFVIDENTLLVEANKIFDTIIKTDFENTLSSLTAAEYSTEDIKEIIRTSADALIEAIKPVSYTSEKMTINGIEVTAHVYDLDAKELEFIVNKIFDKLENDSITIEILSTMTGMDKSLIEDMLAEDVTFSFSDTVTIHLYTSGFLFNYAGFAIGQNEEMFLTYTTSEDESNIELGSKEASIVAKSIDNVTTINIYENGSLVKDYGTLKITKTNENSYTFNYSASLDGSELTLKGNLDFSKTDNNKASLDSSITLEMSMGTESYDMTLDFSLNQEKNKDISSINGSNAVDINSLTDAEKQEISNNLLEAIEGTYLDFFTDLLGANDFVSEEVSDATKCNTAVMCTPSYFYEGQNECVYYDENSNAEIVYCPNTVM